MGKVKFVKRTDVHEIGIFAGYAGGIGILGNELARACPFAESSDGLFVDAANRVLDRETCAEHDLHQVIAEIKLVAAVRDFADEAVVAPILIDRAEIRESTG